MARTCTCPTTRPSPGATPKRAGERLEFGYPLLRLLALIECGTRAVLAAARAEPKTLRYRILHAAARLTRGGRRRPLKIQATWPWAADIVAA